MKPRMEKAEECRTNRGTDQIQSVMQIAVTEDSGIFRVSADFRNGFHLVPSPAGKLQLAFWDEKRMHAYLADFGFLPVITSIH